MNRKATLGLALLSVLLAPAVSAARSLRGRLGIDAWSPAWCAPARLRTGTSLRLRAGLETSIVGVEGGWHDLGNVTWCRSCADAGGSASTKAWSIGVTAGRTSAGSGPS